MVVPYILVPAEAYYLYKNEKGEVEEMLKETGDALIAEGRAQLGELVDFIQSIDYGAIGEGIGSGISAGLSAGGSLFAGIGRELIPNLIESIEAGYNYIAAKLDGQESNIIGAFTVGFLVIFTFLYAFYEIRRGK